MADSLLIESVSNPPIYYRNTTANKLGGTKTFRVAHKKKLKKWGTNLGNIEKSLREHYEADDGKLLCQCDQSGADAFIVAYMMPATNALRQLFLNGIKIHNYLSVAFPEHWEKDYPQVHAFGKVPIKDLREFPGWKDFAGAVAASDNNPPETRYYYLYKQTGHSSNYGIMAPTFVGNLMLKSGGAIRLSVAQGHKFIEGYHKLIPELRGFFHKYVAHQYKTTGKLYNFQGFPIHLTCKYNENEYTKIYDKIPQSTVACITHNAYIALQDFIEDNRLDWDILQNGHDAYVAQAPESEIMDLAKIMRKFMQQTLVNPWGEELMMKAECSIGKNWGPRKEKKLPDGSVKIINPEGLVEVKL